MTESLVSTIIITIVMIILIVPCATIVHIVEVSYDGARYANVPNNALTSVDGRINGCVCLFNELSTGVNTITQMDRVMASSLDCLGSFWYPAFVFRPQSSIALINPAHFTFISSFLFQLHFQSPDERWSYCRFILLGLLHQQTQ